MDPTIAPVAQLYEMNTAYFSKALDGLDRQALLRRLDERTSPMLWIAGHMAGARCGLGPRAVPDGLQFGRGPQG